MDVVLLKDVEKLGAGGAVVRVTPGFARNYLLPRGLALAATPEQLKALEQLAQQRSRKAARLRAGADALKQTLEAKPLTLTLHLGADQKPFGAVTAHDIADALRQSGLELDKHAVRLEQPIKALGVYHVLVRVHPDVTATVKVSVVKA